MPYIGNAYAVIQNFYSFPVSNKNPDKRCCSLQQIITKFVNKCVELTPNY